MNTEHIDRPGRLMRRWVAFVVRFAWPIVIVAVIVMPLMGGYAVNHLGIDTSTADMIARRLPWRQNFSDYRTAFPQLDHTLIAVIDAPDADHADDARDALYKAMIDRDDLFREVFAPGSDAFFKRNALMFLDTDALRDLSNRLALVQPLLAQVAADPTTAGLLTAISRTLTADEIEVDLSILLTRLTAVVEAQNRGESLSLSWQALMSGAEPQSARRVVIFSPQLDFSKLHAARPAIETLRQQEQVISAALPAGVQLRLTGPVALEFEELVSVTRGAKMAGIMALGMVLVILYFALRSSWLVGAALLTLMTGLLATAAFAALAIGSLNLISIAFAVLYIGLGIDFAIHYCLRFREAIAGGIDKQSALIDSAGDVGSSLILCALTTSIGFFAFFPTTFSGVSELGIISGTGMYISLVVTLTLLPALLQVMPTPPVKAQPSPGAIAHRLQKLTESRRLLPAAAALTAAALATVPFVRFDSDPLNLRDARTESVATFLDLLDDPQYSPRSLSVIAGSAAVARALRLQLEQLPSVKSTVSSADLVPSDQDDKLTLIEEIDWLVGPSLIVSPTASDDPRRDREAIGQLIGVLAERTDDPPAQRLAQALRQLLERADASARRDEAITAVGKMLVGTLPGRLNALNDALGAETFSADDLPGALRSRWISADGRYRLEIVPRADAVDFVDDVRAVVPAATGLAVVQREAGRAVVSSFQQAFITAFVLIALILSVLLRNWRQVVIVLIPLVTAGLATTAVMVLIGQPFNFANVIALPLLLGVGVDNGIHMVHRWRSTGDGLLASSTSRAILFSALTTIASFGNLAFSSHPGSASMGTVLSIGMIFTTVCTFLLIPPLLRWQHGTGNR